MTKHTVLDHANDRAFVCANHDKADERASGIKMMIDNPSEVEVVSGAYENYGDYEPDTEDVDAEVIDMTDNETPPDPGTPAAKAADPREGTPTEPRQQETAEAIDRLGESLEDDPLNILPSHMQDSIQGTPAINKRGYAMIAERYGIEVTTSIESYPWDNKEGRCVAKAVAITEGGKEYTGHATACKSDGDMAEQLVELADTRAMKRAVSWASGLGIVAYEELSDEL